MKDKILAVKEFHKAFKLDYLDKPKADLGIDKNKLRFNLMKEENEEYFEPQIITIWLRLLMHLEICFIFFAEP